PRPPCGRRPTRPSPPPWLAPAPLRPCPFARRTVPRVTVADRIIDRHLDVDQGLIARQQVSRRHQPVRGAPRVGARGPTAAGSSPARGPHDPCPTAVRSTSRAPAVRRPCRIAVPPRARRVAPALRR